MKNTNWKPFMMIAVMFFIGLGFLAMMFSSGGDVGPGETYRGWGPGMWGMGPFVMIFPCFGLIVMLFMAFFFFRMMAGGGGPMSGMMGRGGPMSGMMGHSHDPQSQNQVSPTESQDACPSCESPIQAGWKVCPHCGQALA
jgi:hypothetical protein